MTKDLPDPDERELVQLMAAQAVLMDHYDELDAEYKRKIGEMAERYGVEHAETED